MSREIRINKWLQLMEKRTNRVLHQLRLIENLSNKSNYSFDIDNANKALGAIENKLNQVKKTYKEGYLRDDTPFTFEREES
tara:strand:+ start:45 stop:287 length:243 start_codon:yes stop_codon:yes gene_type:complete